MNKTSFAILTIIALTFASNFRQHFSNIQTAESKVQRLTQANQQKWDDLNNTEKLSEHEQWLQKHLQASLDKTAWVQQQSTLTNYSLACMFSIMLIGSFAFILTQRKPYRPKAIDISSPPPPDNAVAQQISWQVTRSLVTNFSAQVIKQKNNHTLRIVSSAAWKVFAGSFVLLGINAFGFAFYKGYISNTSWNLGLEAPFIATGLGLLGYGFLRGWLLDTQKGLAISPLSGKHDLTDIIALQFIAGINGANHRVFSIYEVNLILKNAQRITFIRHNKYEDAMHSAALTARFLSVPLWRQ